jgi:periplasmic divalent cation tolerance protein
MRLILTTFASSDDAAKVVRQLVEERIVACGTILPGARSIYAWKGVIEDTSEVVVFLKTSLEGVAKAQERLLALHPYETAECVVLAPDQVAPKYRDWVLAQVGS